MGADLAPLGNGLAALSNDPTSKRRSHAKRRPTYQKPYSFTIFVRPQPKSQKYTFEWPAASSADPKKHSKYFRNLGEREKVSLESGMVSRNEGVGTRMSGSGIENGLREPRTLILGSKSDYIWTRKLLPKSFITNFWVANGARGLPIEHTSTSSNPVTGAQGAPCTKHRPCAVNRAPGRGL